MQVLVCSSRLWRTPLPAGSQRGLLYESSSRIPLDGIIITVIARKLYTKGGIRQDYPDKDNTQYDSPDDQNNIGNRLVIRCSVFHIRLHISKPIRSGMGSSHSLISHRAHGISSPAPVDRVVGISC
jgi:hypothetical protein